ncbi:MAG TPA: response regulator [Caulobacteraceae bacterium]|jgi:CheY-like chemotaxis protein|nr:response regulator [Caulobacteraceae bacterium]
MDPLRILVVEDEMTIALLIEDMLTDLGHQVVGLAMRLPQAMELAASAVIDFAILDVNLDGHMSFPVADLLRGRGVPFVFATGYGSAGLGEHYRGKAHVVKKPFRIEDLRSAIEHVAFLD